MPSAAQNIVFKKLLALAAERRASDIHLVPGERPMLRIDGNLTRLSEQEIVSGEGLGDLIKSFLSDEELKILERDRQIIVSKTFDPGWRFRIIVNYQLGQISLSLRTIADKIEDLKTIGFPEFVQAYANETRGLVVVSGPFDSGKTATIASFLQDINQRQRRYITTFEHPIEYVFKSQESTIEQREIGRDVPTLLDGLSLVDEEDIDVLAVSTALDPVTTERILRLTEAGRLTFLSVEANTTVQALEQIIHHSSADQRQHLQMLLADVFVGLILQRLVRRVGGGRVLAAELVVSTASLKALLREGRIFQISTLVQTSRTDGMVPLDTALARLVQSGQVLAEEAMRHAQDKEQLKALLRK